MDVKKLEKCLEAYPKLENFITAGNISLKMAREILMIDRYEMYYLFLDLVEAGAVKSTGAANSFRATQELREYMRVRRETCNG